MGLEGGFYGFGLWKMTSLNIPIIFAGFVLLGSFLPATYCIGSRGSKKSQDF